MKTRLTPSRILGLAALLAGLLACTELCHADSPTLLRWGAAPEVEGGPDARSRFVAVSEVGPTDAA